MSISRKIIEQMEHGSWIRRMYDEAAQLKARLGEDAVFDFSLGNPIAPPPPEFFEALQLAVAENPPGAHGYMNNAGYVDVRNAVAAHFEEDYGVPMTAAHVIMCCGAAGGVNVVLKALLNPGDEVIAISPYFTEYPCYVDNHGGVLRLVESGEDFQPDSERLAAAITPSTKAIILNSPNNPTGAVYSLRTMTDIAQVVIDNEKRMGRPLYLVVDDIYRRLVYDRIVVPSAPALYKNTIVVSSFSKDLSIAGERIGYIAISPSADNALTVFNACVTAARILGFVNAPALMQRVITRCIEAKVDVLAYQRNRDVLCEALEKAGFGVRKPKGAFYIFCKCPDGDDLACCANLRAHRIFVVPGSAFGRSGYIRLAYCVRYQTCAGAAAILASC